jgi:TolB protein
MFCTADIDALSLGQIVSIPKSWTKYINNTYNLSLMYPPLWARMNDMHYAGIDGYFRISIMKTDKTLEEIYKTEAYHRLQPYGSRPEIVFDIVSGLDVCLILPSADQPTDMKKQAALIIKSSGTLEIENQAYNYIMLCTDLEHLNAIKNSLVIKSEISS